MKYLLLIAVVVLVLWAMRRASLPPPPPPPPRRPEPPQLEPMVRCSHCGVHLPRSEALMNPDGHAYCCAAHRSAGPRPV
ncbi:PP0621 family protein [Azohydromonas caseinilytica]|uniref:Uncharacterized protein n=1 Tax=Azohydromonas caseinilytica TaxID=2728836 RepID=A0A848F7N2_9BURK|nr:PP0621 family protein [Azohydromonas caseinilytica]NML15178.1 hypothetical protein [Azohydromonas caseinilytica]